MDVGVGVDVLLNPWIPTMVDQKRLNQEEDLEVKYPRLNQTQ